MESSTASTEQKVVTDQQAAAQKQEEPVEEYKDLGEYVADIEPVNVEKKFIPTASYGHRLRIAKLFDSHEEFMYKIITVAGWAKTVRSGGKDFCFIEISDGSYLKGLQVRILLRVKIYWLGCHHKRCRKLR